MKSNKVLLFIVSLFAVLLFSLVFITTDGYGGADSFQHYLISRYSWIHPHLLLDHWGKPVFTLLASPFTHLGYKGLLAFNVLLTLLSAYLVYRISLKLNQDNSALSALFFLLMPMVTLVAVSGLTEPLFALTLVAAVWFFAEKKYGVAIAMLSFLPLVRTEGFVVFPVFAVALLLIGKWKYIPLFAFGALVYSSVGYIAFDDFFWLITRSPYKMESGIYGSGTWYHFIQNSWYIFGTPIAVLTVFGLWYAVPKNLKWFKDDNNILQLVLAGSFAAYFLSHSYVWWKGTGGSLGLERVIAGVCPLAAIIALCGYNLFSNGFKKLSVSHVWILIPLMAIVVKGYVPVVKLYLQQGVEQKEMVKAAEWIKSNPALAGQKFYYYNPHIAFLLDKDIFDKTQVEQLWALIDENDPLLWLQDGQFLVWDAHFGSNEGRTPLDKILHKQNVKILKRFYPDEQSWVLGGYLYEIFILQKQSGWKDSVVELSGASTIELPLPEKAAFSLKKENEFTDVFAGKVQQQLSGEVMMNVEIVFPAAVKLNKDELNFVADVQCNAQSVSYQNADLSEATLLNGRMILKKQFNVAAITDECSTLKLYFWNRAKIDLAEVQVNINFSGQSFSQISSFTLSKENEFLDAFDKDLQELVSSEVVYFDVELRFPAEKKLNANDALFVFDMNCNGRSLRYDATDISLATVENNEQVLRKRYLLPPLTKECAKLKLYFWNRGKIDLPQVKVYLKTSHVPAYAN